MTDDTPSGADDSNSPSDDPDPPSDDPDPPSDDPDPPSGDPPTDDASPPSDEVSLPGADAREVDADPSRETVPPSEDVDDTPTVSCSRCDQEWDLSYELDEMGVGNQALEQFALDHRRHTGHFPDDVSTWRADCRRCPEGSDHLAERAAIRWAKTHARHTRHDVEVVHSAEDERRIVDADGEP